MSALCQKRTCSPPSGVGISFLQKNARRSGRTHSIIVAANPDAAWSPRGRYPTPAVVTVSGGEDWCSDEEEPVVATYEEMVAMYEPSMMKEMGAMANHVTATHVTANHVAATHVAATMACHGERGQ